MEWLLQFHSLVRWLIVLVALGAGVKFAFGWAYRRRGDKMDRRLMAVFGGLIDLQALLGGVLLVGQGLGTAVGFPPFRLEHAVAMLIAVFVAHAPMAWKKNETFTAARNNLFSVMVVLAIVFLGVAVLPGRHWF